MPKALGLIETRGLVAAIEAADAMVKAANVKIVGKELTSPALITIKITGDVAAVKAAVEAGAEAAKKVGELVSVHVIPQPDVQMLTMFPEIGDEEKLPDNPQIANASIIQQDGMKEKSIAAEGLSQDYSQLESESVESEEQHDINDNLAIKFKKPRNTKVQVLKKTSKDGNKVSSEQLGPLFTLNNETIARLREEALGRKSDLVVEKSESDQENEENIDRVTNVSEDFSLANINSLNVHQLRRLARDTENFPIMGREISKANRQELLEHFRRIS